MAAEGDERDDVRQSGGMVPFLGPPSGMGEDDVYRPTQRSDVGQENMRTVTDVTWPACR
jgi:hypothetical protein